MIRFVYSVLCPILTFNMLKTKLADYGLVLFVCFSQKISLVISLGMSSKKINRLKFQSNWLGIAFELSLVGMIGCLLFERPPHRPHHPPHSPAISIPSNIWKGQYDACEQQRPKTRYASKCGDRGKSTKDMKRCALRKNHMYELVFYTWRNFWV